MKLILNARHVVSFLFILPALVLLFFDTKVELQFSRDGLVQGEWWRVLTAHFVHLNMLHGLLNLSVFIVLLYALGRQLSLLRWCLSGAVLCVSTSLCLFYFSPNVEWYVGLSGVLHGFLVLGLIFGAFKNHDIFQGVALLLLVVKIVREQLPSFDILHLSDWIDGAVVVDAHLYGVIIGSVLAAIFLLADFALSNVDK
ncbi:MAG: rhombosortase [Agarilytica sp.]